MWEVEMGGRSSESEGIRRRKIRRIQAEGSDNEQRGWNYERSILLLFI